MSNKCRFNNILLEEGEITVMQTPASKKRGRARKRSFSVEPSTSKRSTTQRKTRRRSLSPIYRNQNRSPFKSRSRSRSKTKLGIPNKSYHYYSGISIPGKIISVNHYTKRGWIYSNYQSRDQCYYFLITDNHRYLSKNDCIYFNNNGLMATNIKVTTSIPFQQIKNEYLTQNQFSISSSNIFVLNTKINVIENKYNEFKQCTNGFNFDLLLKYMNAFINSDGGTIYFGIHNNGDIIGVMNFDRNKKDHLLRHIDCHLRRWKPNKYYKKLRDSLTIKFIQIVECDSLNKIGFILPDRIIIKSSIKNVFDAKNNRITFVDSYDKSYFKLHASIEENCN